MKKLVLVLVSIFLFACSEEKEKETNLVISGNVEGLTEGQLFLQKIKDDTLLVNIDSVQIDQDSHFEMHAYLESPEIMFLYLNKKEGQKNDNIIQFFAEKGTMSIQTQLKNFRENAVIAGSENQKKLEEYEEIMTKFNKRNTDLIQKNFEASVANDQDVLLEVQKRYDQLLKSKYLFTVNYAINHKDMEIAPYLAVAEVYDANIYLLDTIFNSLTKEIQQSRYGKSLKSLLKERRKLEKLDEKVKKQ